MFCSFKKWVTIIIYISPNIVLPNIFNEDIPVIALLNLDILLTFKSLTFNVDGLVKLLIYDNKVFDVEFKLLIDNVELFDKLFTLLNIDVVDTVKFDICVECPLLNLKMYLMLYSNLI